MRYQAAVLFRQMNGQIKFALLECGRLGGGIVAEHVFRLDDAGGHADDLAERSCFRRAMHQQRRQLMRAITRNVDVPANFHTGPSILIDANRALSFHM